MGNILKKGILQKIIITVFILVKCIQFYNVFFPKIFLFYFDLSLIYFIEIIALIALITLIGYDKIRESVFTTIKNLKLKDLILPKHLISLIFLLLILFIPQLQHNSQSSTLYVTIIRFFSYFYTSLKSFLIAFFFTVLLSSFIKFWLLKTTPTKPSNFKFNFVLLFLIIVISTALRIWDLDYLSPFIDEYYNLVAAKNLFINGEFNYIRAPFLTEILSYIFKLKGDITLLGARLFTAILGILNTLLIYLIAKNYNKKVGVISSYLFGVLPLAIGLSRAVREYEFYQFLFLISIFIGMEYLHKKNRFILILTLLISSLLIFYSLKIEFSLPVLFIAFINILFLVKSIFNKFLNLFYKHKKSSFIVFFILFIFALLIFNELKLVTSWLWGEVNIEKQYIHLLFYPYYTDSILPMWFLGINISYLKYLLFLLFAYPLLRLQKIPSIITLSYFLFFSLTVPFVILSDRYFAARYIYYAMPSYIIILSSGIFLLTKDLLKILNLKKLYSKMILGILCILYLLLFSPFNAIYYTLNEKNGEIDKKTEFMHYDENALWNKLEKEGYKDGDIVISTIPNIFVFNKNYTFLTLETVDSSNRRLDGYIKNNKAHLAYEYAKNVYHLHYSEYSYNYTPLEQYIQKNEKGRVTNLIQENKDGWIILDYFRNETWTKNGYNLRSFQTLNSEIEYLGNTGGDNPFYIYKWTTQL